MIISLARFMKNMLKIKDGLPYLFRSFRNKYFNKISLGNNNDFIYNIIIMTLFIEEAQLDIYPIFPGVLIRNIHFFNIYKQNI